MPNKRSIDMTSVFKPEAIEKMKEAIALQTEKFIVLTFQQEDGEHHWKIKITKDNRVLGKEIIMGKPEGLMIVEDEK
jgi:hypothetical protein